MSYFAYVHARPNTVDASGVFYVGKGLRARAMSLKKSPSNRHYRNVVSKHGAENILVGSFECSDEKTAFELERGLIKCLRRSGVKLTNLTDGGEGPSGLKWSEASKKKMSEIRSGKRWGSHTDSSKRKIGAASCESWRDGAVRSKREHGIAQSASKISEGVKASWTKERRAEASARVASRYKDPEVVAAASSRASSFQSSPEYRSNMSKSVAKAWVSPELRKKQSDNMAGRVWIRREAECKRVKKDDLPAYIASGWSIGRN